jgi:hypothetical protein
MGRAIITSQSRREAFPDLVASPPGGGIPAEGEKPDTYRDRLFKYIPGEVVTLYLCLNAIVASANDVPHFMNWVIFSVGVIGTPFYLRRLQKVTALGQLLISTLAFVVWVLALGGPFMQIPGYKQIYGAVLLPIFTFLAAGYSPPPKGA